MNYDLDTAEGMKNAIAWTHRQMSLLRPGGIWFVPRSYTSVQKSLQDPRRVSVHGLLPDPAIKRVLLAAGYTINPERKTNERNTTSA